MIEFFLITVFLGLLFLAFFNPYVGLFSFFVVAYTRPQDFYPFLVNLDAAKWILFITFISFIFYKLRNKEGFVKSKQNLFICGLFGCILISGLKAVDIYAWSQASQDFLKVVLVSFLIVNLLTTQRRLKHFYIFFLFLNLFIALRFYLAYKSGIAVYYGSKPGDATFGFLGNADDLGLGMVVAFPLALVPVLYAKNKIIKIICAGLSLLFIVSALATQSRGAIFGILFIFIAVLLFHLRISMLRRKKLAFGFFIVLLLFAGFYYKYRWSLQEHYETASDSDDSGRVGRVSTWGVAKEMIKSSPLIGIGRANYIANWQMNYSPGVFGYQVAHNIIYEVAAETGLLGLLFFLLFSLYGVKEIWQIRKKYKTELGKYPFIEMMLAIYIFALGGFYFNGMFITVAFYWHIYVLVAMFVSAKNVILKEIENEKYKEAKKEKLVY